MSSIQEFYESTIFETAASVLVPHEVGEVSRPAGESEAASVFRSGSTSWLPQTLLATVAALTLCTDPQVPATMEAAAESDLIVWSEPSGMLAKRYPAATEQHRRAADLISRFETLPRDHGEDPDYGF